MHPLLKLWCYIQGIWSCTSWIILETIKEYLPDLDFSNIPSHPEDYSWFAERWNGRVAMLALVFILWWELSHKQTIWSLIGVL